MATIKPITATQTFPLRHAILRPNHTLEACQYDGDSAPTTLHLGAFIDDQLVGICSIYQNSHCRLSNADNCQLRAMATIDAVRGQGIGLQLLTKAQAHARSLNTNLWANARTTALGFYLQAGFEAAGEEFQIEDIGPHILVIKRTQVSNQ